MDEISSSQTQPNYSPLSPSVAEILTSRHQQIVNKTPELHKKPPRKNKMFIAGIFLFILGIAGLLFGLYSFYRLRNIELLLHIKEIELDRLNKQVKGAAVQITETPTPTMGAITPSPTIDPVKIPVGYVPKQTACYTINMPRDNTAGNETSCELIFDATLDESTDLGISIQTEYEKYNSLIEMSQNGVNSITNKVSLRERVKVGTASAEKVIEELPDSTKLVHVYVYLPNKYKVGGLMATGFEISKTLTPPQEEIQHNVLNTILATWKWK